MAVSTVVFGCSSLRVSLVSAESLLLDNCFCLENFICTAVRPLFSLPSVCSTHVRSFPRPISSCRLASLANRSRWLATEAAQASSSAPPPPPPADPKISRIVDDISGLTLLQAADLVSLLKVANVPPSTSPHTLTWTCPSIVTAEHSGNCHARRCTFSRCVITCRGRSS